MVRVGINGFGRIGRQVLRVILEDYSDKLEVAAVNDLFDAETNAHLFKYDSAYGIFDGTVELDGDTLVANGNRIKNLGERDPKALPWGDLGVDIVVESTGVFRTGPKAAAHIEGGAKKVIISAPGKDVDGTFVLGVNHDDYDPSRHHVVSNASCTTNCLAPPVKVIHDNFGIKSGAMTTVHSYTNGQRILDLPHKDLRRARTAGVNIIPTTTGAAKAIALVIPELEGRVEGFAFRVPTPSVSIVDFTATLEKEATTESLRAALVQAAEGPMKGILGVETEPLVSVDYKGDSRSSIVDLPFTSVYEGNLAKLVTWYDNEWGYSCRVVDLAVLMASHL